MAKQTLLLGLILVLMVYGMIYTANGARNLFKKPESQRGYASHGGYASQADYDDAYFGPHRGHDESNEKIDPNNPCKTGTSICSVPKNCDFAPGCTCSATKTDEPDEPDEPDGIRLHGLGTCKLVVIKIEEPVDPLVEEEFVEVANEFDGDGFLG